MALARQFKVAYNTVRTLYLRYEHEGEAGLVPRYAHCGQTGIRFDPLLYRAACWLKRLHPSWGAAFIRLQLERRYPDRALPAVRTMQSWYRAAGLAPRGSTVPESPKQWADEVHQIWQVDAKEHQKTANGHAVCWLTITDEKSTAVLATPVFPPQANLPGAAEDGADRLA